MGHGTNTNMGFPPNRYHNRSEGAQFYQKSGLSAVVGTPTVLVKEVNVDGYVTEAEGATVPSDADAGYAKGCKFTKTDGGVGSTVFYNEGSETSCDFNVVANSSSDPVTIFNNVGSTLVAGTLVRLSSFTSTSGITVVKADADAGLAATHIVKDAILNSASGIVYPVATVTGLNTNGQTIGDAVFLSATAGGFTFTAPTGIDQIVQQVGTVKVVNAVTGEIAFFPATGLITKAPASMVVDGVGLSGLGVMKHALMVYDFDVDGGTIGNIVPSTSPTIPDNAVVWLDSYDVLTTCTSAGADAGTLKLDFATDGDLTSALAISDALNAWDAGAHLPFLTAQQAGILPVAKKLTGARQPRVVIATQNFTAGKIVFRLAYWISQ